MDLDCGRSQPRRPQTQSTAPASLRPAHLPACLLTRVIQAIKVGDRHFDGAYVYQNEKEAGEDIQRAIRGGLVRREDVFITTKLWNHHHNKEHAIAMAKFQNEQWGLGYIELRLFHSPIALQYIDPATLRYPVRRAPKNSLATFHLT